MAASAQRAFPGFRDQVARARAFVAVELAGCPVTGEAVLCVSELATNALLHTASGDGGKFEVTVERDLSRARISVRDEGSAQAPQARSHDLASESGRGLELVAMIADRWGPAERTAAYVRVSSVIRSLRVKLPQHSRRSSCPLDAHAALTTLSP